jgi:hypothetical protein
MVKLELPKIKNPVLILILIAWILLWLGIEIPLGWQISSPIQYSITFGFNLYQTPEKIGYFWGERIGTGTIYWLNSTNNSRYVAFVFLSVLPFITIFFFVCAIFDIGKKEIPFIFGAIITQIGIGLGLIYTIYNIQTTSIQSYHYNNNGQFISDPFELGFGIDLFLGIMLFTIWVLINKKKAPSSLNKAINIGNMTQKIIQWEFLVLSVIILTIAVVHRIGSLSLYYLKTADFELYFWGYFGPKTQTGFSFLQIISYTNLLPWIMFGALISTSICIILIALPNTKFLVLKKLIKISLLNLGFVIIIWGINLIIFAITSTFQIGFVVFIIMGIEIYLIIKYEILFQKKKKNAN